MQKSHQNHRDELAECEAQPQSTKHLAELRRENHVVTSRLLSVPPIGLVGFEAFLKVSP